MEISFLSLPNDLIFDILCRVPVKSLCRSRCVSRGWCALISGPVFIAAQKSLPAEPFLVVESDRDSCLRLIDLDGSIARVINYRGGCWIPVCMSPVDDVLCVTTYLNGDPVAGMIDLPTMKVLLTNLEFEGAWGCGRAVPSGTYKVVRFNSSPECEVFTIGDGDQWRKRKSFHLRIDHYNLDNHHAAVNGTLHFLTEALRFLPEALPDAIGSILRFDLEREEWKSSIKGPPNVKLGRPHISLGNLNGSLCMVEPENHDNNFGYTNIWRLTDSDKCIWVKAYKIPSDQSMYYQMMPLTVLEDGSKLLLRCNKFGGAPVLQIYDENDGTCTDAMKNVLGDHVSHIGLCSLHLENFISHKIQHAKSSVHCI
ncbi:unnamed protein product [Alopecurus aequalis]